MGVYLWREKLQEKEKIEEKKRGSREEMWGRCGKERAP
jgi:hypothetical protein